MKDFKTIISKRCTCDGKTVCSWCIKQEEDFYKDDYEPIRNADGKIIGVNMDSQEKEIFDFLSERVIAAKKKAINSKSKNELARARGEWYEALLKKDRWLRKFMQKLKLYLKEVEHSPGTALFGSFGSKGVSR